MKTLYLIWLFFFGLQPQPDVRADGPDTCRYDTSRAVTTTLDELVTSEDPMLGNPDADVVLVEFFDPNCIHCRGLHPVMEQVLEKYGDRVRYYKKPFALSSQSVTQVAAMLVAARHDRFYEMAEGQLMSPHFPYLSYDELIAIAEKIGLDRAEFESALEAGEHLNRVQVLRGQARDAGVRGTPTLVIGRPDQVVASDSQSLECISALIDAELATGS